MAEMETSPYETKEGYAPPFRFRKRKTIPGPPPEAEAEAQAAEEAQPRQRTYYKRQYQYGTFRRRRGRKMRRVTPWFSKKGKRYSGLPSFSKSEREYIETVTNPFGHTRYGIGLPKAGKIPDESSQKSISLSFSCNYAIDIASTGPRGVAKLCMLSKNSAAGVELAWSAAGAAAPTAGTTVNLTQTSPINTLLRRWRIVGWGLKMYSTASDDNTSGTLQGGITQPPLRTAVATWNTYVTQTEQLEQEQLQQREGMTVRWMHLDNKDFEYVTWETIANAWDQTDCRSPVIFWDGAAAAGTLYVQVILHIEGDAAERTCPFAMQSSPTSLQWSLISVLVSNPEFAPMVTKGNSFKSFFSHTFGLLPKIASWVVRHAPTALKIAAPIAALA